MSPGLFLSNLPYTITTANLRDALWRQFTEIRTAANQNAIVVKLYSPKPSGRSKGAVVATVSGFDFNYGHIVQQSKGFKISDGRKERSIKVKYDNGDERDEFGNFLTNLSPQAKRAYQCLLVDNPRKVKFVFRSDFLSLVNPNVYNFQTNSLAAYLNGFQVETLDTAGILVDFTEINASKRYFGFAYSSSLECLQSICLFNGLAASDGKVTFVSSKTYQPSLIQRNEGISVDKEILQIREIEGDHGFIPFSELDQGLLCDMAQVKSFCWRCGNNYHYNGIDSNVTFIAATCNCQYDRNLGAMSKSRAFFWNTEQFTRLVAGKMDQNGFPTELIIYHFRMKTAYINSSEYLEIVGPILFEEWKFFSTRFKLENQIYNGCLDHYEFLEEQSSENGETINVFVVELVVPGSKFWCVENRMDIKRLTISMEVNRIRAGRTIMKKKAKVIKHREEQNGSLRMFCRLDLHESVSLLHQSGVHIIPKPDKTTYSSTIQMLNKIAKTPEDFPALNYFLGMDIGMIAPTGIQAQIPGLMHMFLQRLKNELNEKQRDAFAIAKTSQISVVQGPPGCGKTFAASIYSILLKATEKGTILACCPSNFAADALADGIWRNMRKGPCNIRLIRIYAKGLEKVMLEETQRTVTKYTTLHEAVRKHPGWLKESGDEWIRIRALIQNGNDHLLRENELKLLDQHVSTIEDEILTSHDIIVSTVDSLHDQRVLGAAQDITTILLDEAAQFHQPSFPFLLTFQPKRVIILGDHLQLKPHTTSYAAGSAGLETSLMEWFALSTTHIPWTLLVEQHRMTPNICSLVSDVTYDGKLVNAANVLGRTNPFENIITETSSDIIVFNHQFLENKDFTSYRNVGEAHLLQSFVEKLLLLGMDAREITVISLYESQRSFIRTLLPRDLEVVNCDGFQGKENKIIVVSLTRGNRDGNIGFAANPNRLNVSISRAMYKLIIFGNLQTFKAHRNKVWTTFLKKIVMYGKVFDV